MRRTIRIDEHGHVRMEGNPQEEVWMTLAEIADLFNLPAATIGREIKAIRKTGVLVDYETCKYIRMADGCSVDIYHWGHHRRLGLSDKHFLCPRLPQVAERDSDKRKG